MYETELASALCVLGEQLAHLHRYDEALDPAEEAAASLRRLSQSHPGR